MRASKNSTVVYGLTEMNTLEKNILVEAIETCTPGQILPLIKHDHPDILLETVEMILDRMFKVLTK